MMARCKRQHYNNALSRVIEVGEMLDIDPKNPRMERFFDLPQAPAAKPVEKPKA